VSGLRHPPGRTGRAWLAERLAVARRAAGVLEHEQEVLRREERRLDALVERTASTWTTAVRRAERWERRALVLGGRAALAAAAATARPATVELVWRTATGVRFPAEAACEPGGPDALGGPSALDPAADAYRAALTAAVEHAAARRAHDLVAAEVRTAGQRLHAVRDRWVPRLEGALTELELRLDEHEREELVRSRAAAPPREGT